MINPFDRPVPGPITIEEGKTYVLCEGTDEVALVRAVAKNVGLSIVAGICAERDSLDEELHLFRLSAVRKRPHALGVVVDKETDGRAVESNLRRWLTSAGFSLPTSAGDVYGPALPDANLRLGYFLNPDGSDAGAIEQLFLDQIDQGLKPCVESFIACAEDTGIWEGRESKAVLKDKVRLRVYLAAKKAGGNTGLNVALQDRILTVSNNTFEGITAFLHKLFAQ